MDWHDLSVRVPRASITDVNPTALANELESSEREVCAAIIEEARQLNRKTGEIDHGVVSSLVRRFRDSNWWSDVLRSSSMSGEERRPVLEIVCEKRVDPDPSLPGSTWSIHVSSGSRGHSIDFLSLGSEEQQCIQMFMATGNVFFCCKTRGILGHSFRYHQFRWNALLWR